VVRTRVGYAGGQQRNPTYHDLGDHTESLQIDFDSTQVSYGELLDLFWKTHNPCARPGSRQYMSAVFYHSEEQKQLIVSTRDREAGRRGSPVTTQILPATEFWLAEDYHQKYMLRRRSNLMREFQAMYPEEKDFVASTAAARVNGYLGGNGSAAALEKELPMLGLTTGNWETLRQAFGRGR
jgi:methionine-S-sulfoxide reductase